MRILFLGEGPLNGSARYLAAILTWSKIPFDHRPNETPLPLSWQERSYDAVILSDYRYANWTRSGQSWLTKTIENGMGLLMIGGWASFTGLVGGYRGTAIERLLPVNCLPQDDRINRPAVLISGNKPLAVVNGYHRVRPKPGVRVVLEFRDLLFRKNEPGLGGRHPALILGKAGKGRTAALMTDCAPHWAGGLVDWGNRRIRVRVGKDRVELGENYLRFFRRWILWVAGKTST